MPLLQLVWNIKISKTTFARLIIVETISFNFLALSVHFFFVYTVSCESFRTNQVKMALQKWQISHCCACTLSSKRKIDVPKAIRDVHMHAILEQVYVKREMQLHFCRYSVKREENVPRECRSRAFKWKMSCLF